MAKAQNDYMDNFENIIGAGNEVDMMKDYKPLVAYKMENYLNPKQLKAHVLKSEKITKLINHYAQKQNCPPSKIEQQVKVIIDEIGLDRNMAIIRWCGIAITCIGKRICSGIYVNNNSVNELKNSLGSSPVLYLPTHRSYMDFILMSYICFYYDIEIPGIAGGMDFYSMFAMGTMLRKTGAFFMRRSFSDDELYWDVFREYVYALVAVYHIGVEFFIEGTRSRNFKSLVPKIGLLSMALLPYFTGEVSDITIVPVSVSYEKILEEQLFVYELLGVPKPKESTKGFFKALKIIDERFGKMYLDFGKPISVRDFFGHKDAQRIERATLAAHLQQLNKNEIELIKKLANEIIYQQQRRIVINTFNLLSLYYSSQLYNQSPVNIDELARGITLLKGLFQELGAHVSTNLNAIKPEIIKTVEIHSNIVHFHQANLRFTKVAAEQLAQEIDMAKLKGYALLPQTMAIALPSLSLQLYINPCLFWLARPAYLIMAALQIQQEQQQLQNLQKISSHSDLLANLSHKTAELDQLFKYEFIIESNREDEEFHRNLHLLKTYDILKITTENGLVTVNMNDCCRVLLSALAPFLCVYYQLVVTINKEFPTGQHTFTNKDVLTSIQERIEQLLLENSQRCVHPYCLALDNLNIAIHALIQESYLMKNRENGDLRRSPHKSLSGLEQQLAVYCDLMPFKQYYMSGDQIVIDSKL
uniref:Phospholipid/glycerol acyltransferase domain-containing protein n=1 Tax=Glossina pallidipes TaxID=7398 RepID=A0A1A9Z3V3_GLOPL